MRTEVHKFGGTSVGSAERIRHVAHLCRDHAKGVRLVVVASAMTGVTDALLGMAARAAAGERVDADVTALAERHHVALSALSDPAPVAVTAEIDAGLAELRQILRAVALVGELTPRVKDRIVAWGEKLAVRLLAESLRGLGADAVAVDADTFVETDGQHGEASPLAGVAERTIRSTLNPLLDAGKIPVVTGFCGRGPDGATTTLGRGGSDLSATILAGALGADSVVIWTDVPGVYSADPRMVPEARVIPHLNYREAAELSFYGAKVLHQRTMIPVTDQGIPVWTKSSMEPDLPGTLVDGAFTPGSHPVKGISAVRGQALISVEGKGMAGVPGVAARVFGALADKGVSVTMISQSSSESSICLAVPAVSAQVAERALKAAFRAEASRGDVEEVAIRPGVALVAAVGLGMARAPGVAARIFGACGKHRVNILAIAQGSSELNVTLAVDDSQIATTLRAIHNEFGLHRQDTGDDDASRMDVVLLGFGRIGRALVAQLHDRRAGIRERFGLTPRVVGVSDRTGVVFDPKGLSDDRLAALVAAKKEGRRFADLPDGAAISGPLDVVRRATDWRLVRPVLVDVTDADTHDAFEAALSAGFDVVTANKVPVAAPSARFEALRAAGAKTGRLLKAEATVGAGLPVVDTLENLVATGDRVTRARGCFSGTLGYLSTRLEDGVAFSVAVREAMDKGYTEPDPVIDLSGEDVARKAIILARYAGLLVDGAPVKLEGFVDKSWLGLPTDVLFERLKTLDDAMAARVAKAKAAGRALRFVATVQHGTIEVGPQEVEGDGPIGRMRGTDNLVVFESERYADRPLVVSGPGAGVDVTAMGVLGDLLRVAAERR
jgi:aspartokinase/homoserine dehydrogenase 1